MLTILYWRSWGGEGGKWVGVRHLLAFHVIRSFRSKIRLAVIIGTIQRVINILHDKSL